MSECEGGIIIYGAKRLHSLVWCASDLLMRCEKSLS